MKRKLCLMLIATFAAISCSRAEKKIESISLNATVISSGIRFSEGSVIAGNDLLVSNFGGDLLDPMNNEGKGYISKISGSTSQVIIPVDGNLSAPKGMAISGSHLLIADVGKVVVYDLNNKTNAPQIISMPEGNMFVNDIAISGRYAYISVTNTGIIFKLDISSIANLSTAELTQYAMVIGANGLVIDGNTMYVASYPADGNTTADNVLYVIEEMAMPKPEKLIMNQGQYDGITLNNGCLYFSNWVDGQIGYVNLKTKEVVTINIDGAKITGPADMSIFQNKLYIPNLPSSEIVVVQL